MRKRTRHGVATVVTLLLAGAITLGAGSALAQGEREVPFLSGRVVDLAGMVDEGARGRLEARLAAYEEETGSQIAVLTVPDLDGEPIEDYSMRVVETWKLGRADVDDGVLLLIAQQERRLRIEVGYGLEGTLTDAYSRRILDNVITPRFRQGDFSGGVEAGTDAILAVLAGNADELPQPAPQADIEIGPIGCVMVVFVLLFVFLLFVVIAKSARRGGGRRGRRRGGFVILPGGFGGGGGGGGGFGGGGFGGGFGGGGFGGGGGGFGGGGASGGW